jgi:hypothetical protein
MAIAVAIGLSEKIDVGAVSTRIPPFRLKLSGGEA